jgi:hypothetical protein
MVPGQVEGDQHVPDLVSPSRAVVLAGLHHGRQCLLMAQCRYIDGTNT